MAITAMIGLDHYPVDYNASGGSFQAMNPYGVTFSNGGANAGYGGGLKSYISVIWLGGVAGSNGISGAYNFIFKTVGIDVTAAVNYIFGFRWVCSSNTSTQQIASIQVKGAAVAGAYLLIGDVPNILIATQYYIEAVVDKINNVVTWFCNGVQVKTTSVPTLNTQVATDALVTSPANAGGSTQGYRDFYFISVNGVGKNTRLGPVTVRPLTLSTVTKNDWATSDGSDPLTFLGKPFASAAAAGTTPVISSALTQGLLATAFTAPNVNAAEKPLALVTHVTSRRTALLATGKMTPSAIQGGKTLTGTPITWAAQNTMTYSIIGTMSETAPDGTAWTPTNIAATSFQLQPADS